MAKQSKFTISFAPQAIEHFDLIATKYHGLLSRTISEQLTYAPAEATRNRKPLDQPAPFDATWELRCVPDNRLRIFYEIDPAKQSVSVLAVGVKDRSRLLIGREEFDS